LQGGYRAPGCAEDLLTVLSRMGALRPEGVGRLSTADLLATRRQELATLAAYADAGVLEELDRALCAAAPPEPGARAGLVHADLHLRQFLACSQGLRLVDFERAALGDPGLDMGHFVSEFRFAALERPREEADLFAVRDRLLELWRARAAEGARRALPFFIATGFVAGAARIARRTFLGADPAVLPSLLDEAREQLSQAPQR
jgi:aminoglycoside phosphotransferase (APT) family kinase protein